MVLDLYQESQWDKCNNHKFSVRKGMFLDHSKYDIQLQLRIIGNFIHRLSIVQGKDFCNVGMKTDHTIGKFIMIVEMYVLFGYGILNLLQI